MDSNKNNKIITGFDIPLKNCLDKKEKSPKFDTNPSIDKIDEKLKITYPIDSTKLNNSNNFYNQFDYNIYLDTDKYYNKYLISMDNKISNY